jgi:hypothetical protein
MSTIYDYATGDVLKVLVTDADLILHLRYLMCIEGDKTFTGAVDGTPYGYPGKTIYMED